MSLFAGIDYDSNAIHVVLLDENTDLARYHRRALAGTDAVRRIRRIRTAMPAPSLWRDEVIAIGIEEPFARGKGGGYTMQLALGAILACLPPDLDLLLLRADDWRKQCDLPTRRPRDDHKAASKRFARDHWHDHPPTFDDNAADAYAIAYATRRLVEARAAAA